MAHELVTLVYCDVCLETLGERVEAQPYGIIVDGKTSDIDLCPVHAKPIVEIADFMRPPEPAEVCPVAGCGRRLQTLSGVRRHLTRTHKLSPEAVEAALTS